MLCISTPQAWNLMFVHNWLWQVQRPLMKLCPKPIAWTLPTGLHLLCKEPNQPMGFRKNILVVQALQVVQVALAMHRWTWEILCLLHSGMPVCRDFCSHNNNHNKEMQVRLNVLHVVKLGIWKEIVQNAEIRHWGWLGLKLMLSKSQAMQGQKTDQWQYMCS